MTPTTWDKPRLARLAGLLLLSVAVAVASWVARPLFPSLPVDLPLGEFDHRVVDTPAGRAVDARDAGLLVPLSLLAAAACGAAVLVVRRWRAPLYATTLVGWLAFGMWPAILVASFLAATTLRRGPELWAYAVAAGSAIMMPGIIRVTAHEGRLEPQWLSLAVLEAALLLGVPVLAGLLVRARQELRGGARARDEGRRREQEARYAQARAQERARIAREMHDVVAHRVSLMVLHAGALEVRATDEETAGAAALIRSTGREALTDLREVLGVLRSPDAPATQVPGLAHLDDLLAASRALGVAVSRRDEGEPRQLPPAVERAAYRLVQEALTNVHRHTGDAPADVLVRYLPDSLRIDVRNAPSRPPPTEPSRPPPLGGPEPPRPPPLGGPDPSRSVPPRQWPPSADLEPSHSEPHLGGGRRGARAHSPLPATHVGIGHGNGVAPDPHSNVGPPNPHSNVSALNPHSNVGPPHPHSNVGAPDPHGNVGAPDLPGSGGAPDLPGSGLGLIGLRERVELLGGRFAAGPAADGGFLVSASLPAHTDDIEEDSGSVQRREDGLSQRHKLADGPADGLGEGHRDGLADRLGDGRTDGLGEWHGHRLGAGRGDQFADGAEGEHTGGHADRLGDRHGDQLADEAAGDHAGGHADRLADRHGEQLADEAADDHAGGHADRLADRHGDQLADKAEGRLRDKRGNPDVQRHGASSGNGRPDRHEGGGG